MASHIVIENRDVTRRVYTAVAPIRYRVGLQGEITVEGQKIKLSTLLVLSSCTNLYRMIRLQVQQDGSSWV